MQPGRGGAIEAHLSGLLTSFVVTSDADRKLLRQIIGKQARIDVMVKRREPRFRVGHPSAEFKQAGYPVGSTLDLWCATAPLGRLHRKTRDTVGWPVTFDSPIPDAAVAAAAPLSY